MGKGKGEPEYWVAVVKPGTVLFEIGGVTEEAARMCFARLAHKMPVRVRLVRRRTAVGAGQRSEVDRFERDEVEIRAHEQGQRTARDERRATASSRSRRRRKACSGCGCKPQTERLDAPSELRKQRRLIARIKTIQTAARWPQAVTAK